MTTLANRKPTLDPGRTDLQEVLAGAFLRLRQAWQRRVAASAERRKRRMRSEADRQLWNTALGDPRIMAEIASAQARQP